MEKRFFTFNNHAFNVVLRDDVDASVFAEIFKLHEYRRAEEKIKTAEHAIVDVGAHAGFFTLYARGLNPTASIFALEPEPGNLQALEKTIAENQLTNIIVIPKGLHDKTGRENLIITPDSHNHFLERPFKDGTKKLRVATISFGDLRSIYKIEKISVLKMDIEGGEYTVLGSLQSDDFKAIETIILEYHNTKSKTYAILETILRENGFSVELFPSKFEKTMGFLFAQNKRFR